MHNSADRATLAACLAPQGTSLPPVGLPALSEPHLALAASQFILPTLHPRLQARHALPLLPPPLAQTLATVTELNRERNQFILANARSVVALLNHAGIQPIALKGLAYLLANIFPDPAERFLLDLDFLIPESQLPTAIQALTAAGYTHPPDHFDFVAHFRHHAAPLLPPQTGVPVELHHSIGLGLPSQILPASAIIQNSTLDTADNLQVRIPSPEHLVTHLILHSQIRHTYDERIWPPLRALYDLLCLTQHFSPDQINWPSIQNRFRAAGQLTTLKLHLLEAEKTLRIPRPFPITLTPFEHLRWLRRRLLNRWPALRFLDPTYLVLATLSRRVRLLQSILSTPGGYKSALRTLTTLSFYRRLLSDLFSFVFICVYLWLNISHKTS